MASSSSFYIVAVHGGAGVHSSQTDAQVKHALKLWVGHITCIFFC